MKKPSKRENRGHGARNGLRKEYRFDYAKAQTNRFAFRMRQQSVVVLLAPDVAKVFRDAASVNAALRAILKAVPAQSSRK